MASLPSSHRLAKRNRCYIMDGTEYCYYSAWDDWVRWVVLAVILISFLIFFMLCSCISARRRRRMGQNPYWGTGWASRNHGIPQYNPHAQWPQNPQYGNPQYNNAYGPPPAPPYSPPTGGYFGPQQSGIELQNQPQAPPQAHRGAGGENVYAPPAGPPPGKADGVIR